MLKYNNLFPNTDTPTLGAKNYIRYNSSFNYKKNGAFFQMGKRALNNRLGISAGIRKDGNTFTNTGNQIMRQISPRVGLSLVLSDQLTWNAYVGKYFKLAPNTALGFKDASGNYLNRDVSYIGSFHYVTGIEYLRSESTRFTAEVFYKRYTGVPISNEKGISLSNLGADFNILGNEDISTIGIVRSYGF